MTKLNQPTIETIINTAAIALSTFGVTEIMAGKWYGFVVIVFAGGIEFFKYWGRKKKYW